MQPAFRYEPQHANKDYVLPSTETDAGMYSGAPLPAPLHGLSLRDPRVRKLVPITSSGQMPSYASELTFASHLATDQPTSYLPARAPAFQEQNNPVSGYRTHPVGYAAPPPLLPSIGANQLHYPARARAEFIPDRQLRAEFHGVPKNRSAQPSDASAVIPSNVLRGPRHPHRRSVPRTNSYHHQPGYTGNGYAAPQLAHGAPAQAHSDSQQLGATGYEYAAPQLVHGAFAPVQQVSRQSPTITRQEARAFHDPIPGFFGVENPFQGRHRYGPSSPGPG